MANAMRQLPSHRVGRGELVVELAGYHLKQQSLELKASNSEAQTRKTRAARRSQRLASLADLVGPQKTILLSTRRTRENVPIAVPLQDYAVGFVAVTSLSKSKNNCNGMAQTT